jgi:predicted  nucleic acid-binding Zn-ribbon protein
MCNQRYTSNIFSMVEVLTLRKEILIMEVTLTEIHLMLNDLLSSLNNIKDQIETLQNKIKNQLSDKDVNVDLDRLIGMHFENEDV